MYLRYVRKRFVMFGTFDIESQSAAIMSGAISHTSVKKKELVLGDLANVVRTKENAILTNQM